MLCGEVAERSMAPDLGSGRGIKLPSRVRIPSSPQVVEGP